MLRNTAQGTTNEALLLLEGGSGYKEGSVELFGKAFYPAHSWQGQTIVCVCLSYIPGRLTQLCLTLPNPMDCNSPGSSVHGISQARLLEWVSIPFSRGSSGPRDQTWVSRIGGRFFTAWATGEARIHQMDCSVSGFPGCYMYKVREIYAFKKEPGNGRRIR